MRNVRFYTIVLILLVAGKAAGQDTLKNNVFTPNTREIISISPEESGSEKTAVANLNETKLNEAPGSVYIITGDEIQKRGYKDLIDVFMDVPGMNIATDVQNGTGLTLRGFWANEARLLVMIDGMILNDMAYGSFVISGRLPLLNIERIEIIRGASSSIYGGIAGLGVIHIITRTGKSSSGGSFTSDVGISRKALATRRLAFAHTSYLLNNFELSLCGSIYKGNRSNETYQLPDSSIVNYMDSSLTEELFVELRLKRKSFEYKVLFDDYSFQASHEPATSIDRTFLNDLVYNRKFKKVMVTAQANLKEQAPWNLLYGDPAVYDLQSLRTRRVTLNANTMWDITPDLHLLTGLSAYNDYMRFSRRSLRLFNGKYSDNFNAFAGFAECSYTTRFANFFAGGRFDAYESFKPRFSPRFSITREFRYFHYKLIYGESFKIPTLQNINLTYMSTKLAPEKIKDFQVEAGTAFGPFSFTANAYSTRIDNVIVYGYDLNTFVESYVNSGYMSVCGLEATAGYRQKKLALKATFSNYILYKTTTYDFAKDSSDATYSTLAVPRYKITLNGQLQLNRKFSLKANYIYQSDKCAVEQVNSTTGEYAVVLFKPTHLVDCIVHVNSIIPFCDLNAGFKNVLNTKNFYAYPVASGYPAAIGMGREFYFQLKLNL